MLLLLVRERLVLQSDALGLASMPADRIVDRHRQAIMHQLRSHAQPPERRRPHLVGSSLFEIRFNVEDPLLAPFGVGLDSPDALAGFNVIGDLLAVLKSFRW